MCSTGVKEHCFGLDVQHVRQPEGSETPQPWDFSGVHHPDLIWLQPKRNAQNNRAGCICFSLRPFSGLTKQTELSSSQAFLKQQEWLSDRIACYTIIYCFSSSQMNWAFCWVKKSHAVVTDSASYTVAVTRRGLWQSPHVLETLLKWVTLPFPESCPTFCECEPICSPSQRLQP